MNASAITQARRMARSLLSEAYQIRLQPVSDETLEIGLEGLLQRGAMDSDWQENAQRAYYALANANDPECLALGLRDRILAGMSARGKETRP